MTNFSDSTRMRRWRPKLVWSLLCFGGIVLVLATAGAQVAPPPRPEPEGKHGPNQPPLPMFTEEREAAALTFVRKNGPELLKMLEQLKARNPGEYERAIRDLFRTSEMFASIRQEDPARYELALKGWQAEMHTHLLMARLVHQREGDQAKRELKEAVEKLVDLQLERVADQVRRLETELERARRHHQEIKGRRDEIVRQQLEARLKAVEQQRSRAPDSEIKP